MKLAFLRHGPTDWNAERRLQGHADIPLSAAGREQVLRYRLPSILTGGSIFSSPLARARETAALVTGSGPVVEPLLIEMDWGAWEGERLAELRERYGVDMKKNEDLGLDFRPPDGESPREVQGRLKKLFEKLQSESYRSETCLAVTHKGVIRAALALAWDWDMLGKPPARLDWSAVHMVRLGPGGAVAPDEINMSLQS